MSSKALAPVLLTFATFIASIFLSPTAFAKPDGLAQIKERKEIAVGINPGFVPFEMKLPNGEWAGFDVELAQAFARELGVKVRFVDTRFDGLIPALLARKFDIILSGVSVTPERQRMVAFTDSYYQAGLVTLVNKKVAPQVKSVTDLNAPERTVAVSIGTTGDFHASKHLPKAQIRKFDAESDAANAVAFGKVDAFLFDKPYLQIFARRNEARVQLLSDLVTKEDLAAAARKGDTELVTAFNGFLRKFKESGEMEKLMNRHFVEMPWVKDLPELK